MRVLKLINKINRLTADILREVCRLQQKNRGRLSEYFYCGQKTKV